MVSVTAKAELLLGLLIGESGHGVVGRGQHARPTPPWLPSPGRPPKLLGDLQHVQIRENPRS